MTPLATKTKKGAAIRQCPGAGGSTSFTAELSGDRKVQTPDTAANRPAPRHRQAFHRQRFKLAKLRKRWSGRAHWHGRNGEVPRRNLGATDCRSAFARPFDVHGCVARYESSALVMGSRRVRRGRRTGSGRPAPRGGRASVCSVWRWISENARAI